MKNIIITITIILAALTILFGIRFLSGDEDTWLCENNQWVKHGVPNAPMPSEPCGKKEIASFQDCISAGYPILESYPSQCKTPEGKTFTEDIGNELEKPSLIKIASPRPNQTIVSPLSITGEASGNWFFEASFPIRLLDDNGNLITTAIAQAQSDWMTENFVPFKAEINFTKPATENGILVLEKDNPSGLPESADELRVPIKFGAEQETMKVKAYFNNDKLDPEITCYKVFPVEREVPKTQAVARAALEELLKCPTEQEKQEGYITNINPGVKIQSLNIIEGVVKVDFDKTLEQAVGGSCRVTAIRAQITQTLEQFPTVEQIIISIDGRTEDILQP